MLDVSKFISDNFGGHQGLHDALSAEFKDAPNPQSVYKYVLRESIPAKWLAAALVVLEKRAGRPVSMAPYVTGGRDDVFG